jgi:hypothetical protein
MVYESLPMKRGFADTKVSVVELVLALLFAVNALPSRAESQD